MLDSGYAFITAYLKGEEARTVTSGHLAGMVRVVRVQDLLTAIAGTDIGDYFENVQLQNFDEIDHHLWDYFSECVKHLEWFKGTPAELIRIVRVYLTKYDVINIKTALYGIRESKKVMLIPLGTIYRNEMLNELEKASDVVAVMEVLNHCGLQDYAEILKGYDVEESIKAHHITDHNLVERYYTNLLEAAGKTKDSGELIKVFRMIIDLKNLNIALRAVIGGIPIDAADYFVDGGYMISRATVGELVSIKPNEIPGKLEGSQYRLLVEEILTGCEKGKNVLVIDEVIEKHKLRMVKEILAPRVMSPIVAIWYLFLKELELRNIRLLFKAVFDDIPIDEIKDYLVMTS